MLDKLGMVVKLSDLEHGYHAEESIGAWEQAAAAVLARERALQEVVKIRKDPAKQSLMEDMQAKIDLLSEACAPPIKELLDVHGDIVTLRGMPYLGDLSAPLNDVLDRVEGKVRR